MTIDLWTLLNERAHTPFPQENQSDPTTLEDTDS